MSAEYFSRAEAGEARAHFENVGHVVLVNLVDPSMAQQVIREAEAMSYGPRARDGGGEQINLIRPRTVTANRQPEFYEMLQEIYEGAELLGRDLRPARWSEEARRLLIDMKPGSRGEPHFDKPDTVEVGAVTNLVDSSNLWFEDGTDYRLNPGDVAFHDHDRHLFHGGYTGPQDHRIGLVVTKATKNRKLIAKRTADMAPIIANRQQAQAEAGLTI